VRTTGGLSTALDAALRSLGGRWISSGPLEQPMRAPADAEGRSYDVEHVRLTPREHDGYYGGFANRVLWPLFHYFVGRVNFDPAEWGEFVKVNGRFAVAVVRALEEGREDAVAWVHDYHLMLAPRMIRDRRPGARVGFFLHVPFPAYEAFRILPTRVEILEGLLGADLVGFHTAAYRDAFLESCRRLLGARVDRTHAVLHRGRRTATLASPIGIDVAWHEAVASDPATVARARRLRRHVPGEVLLLGVDRLDYSKGLLERLSGLARLFERHPEHRGRVTLVQVAVPSRVRVEEYRQLKRQVDEAVGKLEGRFGDESWSPVRYIARALAPEELAAWYRAADVCLVTPLRDGLNLVAKEYVATRTDGGGALVLSEFAGAVEELPQAYVVNPFGPDNLSGALHAAITDDRLERLRRMEALRGRVCANDVHLWASGFLRQLDPG
jgi:trehalose 6-phosphate synthase